MERILVVGASLLQLPAILKAKALGYYVGVVDINPEAVGVPYADAFFNISTNDEEGITAVAEQFGASGVMTIATDRPMRSVAKATKHCGLPGISVETAIRATDKYEMIKAFEKNNVPHPAFFYIPHREELQRIKKDIPFPCIIKPVDNAGSRGVVFTNRPEDLEKNYEYAATNSPSGRVIIEEYLEGPEVSVEILVIKGEPHVIQVTDKVVCEKPFFVEIGHSQPSRLDESVVEAIKTLAIDAVKAIGIDTGPAHVEMIITSSGPKMVELGARLGGDCITSHLVPLSTGVDMVKATIELACGKEPDISQSISMGSAVRFICADSGQIKSIQHIEDAMAIESVVEITLTKRPGDYVNGIENSNDRIGFVISQGSDADSAIMNCEKAISRISVITE